MLAHERTPNPSTSKSKLTQTHSAMGNATYLAPVYIVYADTASCGSLVDRLRGGEQVRGASFTETTAELTSAHGKLVQRVVVWELTADDRAQGLADALTLTRPEWLILAGVGEAITADLPLDAIVLPEFAALKRPKSPLPDVGSPGTTNATTSSPHGWIEVSPLIRQAELLPHRTFWGIMVESDLREILNSPASTAELRGPSGNQMERGVAVVGWAELVETCQRFGVAWTAAVGVRHTARQPLSTDLQKVERQRSWAGKLGAAAAAIWQRPRAAWELLQEGQRQLQSGDRLAGFLVDLLTPTEQE